MRLVLDFGLALVEHFRLRFGLGLGRPYVYPADGYGSSKVHVYYRANGTYTGTVVGGHGTAPGLFRTCHAITSDWRLHEMVVSDRENHRLQYFSIAPTDPSVFQLQSILSFAPLLNQPCDIRFHEPTKHAIVPFLEGTVAILDDSNHVVSVLNTTDALGDQGFLHPHDAHFIKNGDFVLVTWNPGRIGYFRRVPEKKGFDETSGLRGSTNVV
jgi:hypothetical protein